MAIPTKRFEFLDKETNVPINSFIGIDGNAILNKAFDTLPPELGDKAKSLFSKLDLKSLTSGKGGGLKDLLPSPDDIRKTLDGGGSSNTLDPSDLSAIMGKGIEDLFGTTNKPFNELSPTVRTTVNSSIIDKAISDISQESTLLKDNASINDFFGSITGDSKSPISNDNLLGGLIDGLHKSGSQDAFIKVFDNLSPTVKDEPLTIGKVVNDVLLGHSSNDAYLSYSATQQYQEQAKLVNPLLTSVLSQQYTGNNPAILNDLYKNADYVPRSPVAPVDVRPTGGLTAPPTTLEQLKYLAFQMMPANSMTKTGIL